LWEAELANALWMANRHPVLSLEDAAARLTLADGLGIHAVPNRTLWQGALVRAHQSKVPVCDTLFVELAAREGLPLATFDTALLKAFPGVAARPGAITPRQFVRRDVSAVHFAAAHDRARRLPRPGVRLFARARPRT
jgi:hypothetical protein